VIHEIRLYGDPVLRAKSEPVEAVDDDLRNLIQDLMETMYDLDGIGLAAPQVGVPARVFVYDIRGPEVAAGALINPEIVERGGTAREEEGCLSLPGLADVVERDERIVVRGLDLEGAPVEFAAHGLLSRCIQHEIDHLDGVLFIDRLSPLKRRLLLRKWQKRDAEEPAGRG
jgi:peptide deformylase